MSTSSDSTPSRPRWRWRQFSLSLIFVLTTIVSVPLAWEALQRHEARQARLARGYPTRIGEMSDDERKIAAALDNETIMEFIETPLSDVVSYLRDFHQVTIRLDASALREAKVDEQSPVSSNLRGISLRSALRHVLSNLNLTYVVRDDCLLVTTPEATAKRPGIRVYNVAHLLAGRMTTEQFAASLTELFSQRSLPVRIVAHRNLLLVDAPFAVQEELDQLLAAIQEGTRFEIPP